VEKDPSDLPGHIAPAVEGAPNSFGFSVFKGSVLKFYPLS
jgi:hypothetical protein